VRNNHNLAKIGLIYPAVKYNIYSHIFCCTQWCKVTK